MCRAPLKARTFEKRRADTTRFMCLLHHPRVASPKLESTALSALPVEFGLAVAIHFSISLQGLNLYVSSFYCVPHLWVVKVMFSNSTWPHDCSCAPRHVVRTRLTKKDNMKSRWPRLTNQNSKWQVSTNSLSSSSNKLKIHCAHGAQRSPEGTRRRSDSIGDA